MNEVKIGITPEDENKELAEKIARIKSNLEVAREKREKDIIHHRNKNSRKLKQQKAEN